MKKILFALALLLPLTACDEQPVPASTSTKEDFLHVRQMIKDAKSIVIAAGTKGDFLIHLNATPELLKIAENTKTSKFLSIQKPQQYITDGKCLVNIIPYATQKKLEFEKTNCNYRLFCGNEISDKYYAVELCE